jgi:hypothetical protein
MFSGSFEHFQQFMSHLSLVIVEVYGLVALVIVLWKRIKKEIDS